MAMKETKGIKNKENNMTADSARKANAARMASKAAAKPQLKKSGAAKPAYKAGAKPAGRSKAGASTVAAVAKRFGVTAREARDIATALGTYGTLKFDPDSKYDRYSTQKIEKAKAVKNIKKQISETVTAAKTGKKGTSSGVAMFGDGEVPYTYFKGDKRK